MNSITEAIRRQRPDLNYTKFFPRSTDSQFDDDSSSQAPVIFLDELAADAAVAGIGNLVDHAGMARPPAVRFNLKFLLQGGAIAAATIALGIGAGIYMDRAQTRIPQPVASMTPPVPVEVAGEATALELQVNVNQASMGMIAIPSEPVAPATVEPPMPEVVAVAPIVVDPPAPETLAVASHANADAPQAITVPLLRRASIVPVLRQPVAAPARPAPASEPMTAATPSETEVLFESAPEPAPVQLPPPPKTQPIRAAVSRAKVEATVQADRSQPKPTANNWKIEGIFWSSERPMAILNGNIVKVGSTVDSGKVIAIDRDCITISTRNGTLKLRP